MHTILRSIKRGHHRSVAFQRALLREHGITPARYEMLFVIFDTSPVEWMTQSDLTRALGVTRMTVSRMVRGLAEQGLVERQPCFHDRRTIELRLTKEGRALMKRIHRLLIAPGIVWIALYTVLGLDGEGPGALEYHLDVLRRGFYDQSTFIWQWCDRTLYPERYRRRPPPPFEWPQAA